MAVLKPIAPSIPVNLPTGTALKAANLPTLFTAIKIRGLQLQNRFVVSPMGTWSSQDGKMNDFHVVHYGQFALRGAGLTVIESTAVSANGRTSPQDAGLWKDSQVAPLKRVVDFVHSQGQKIGIQLNHAGRKASMLAPELSSGTSPIVATELDGGWSDNIWGPSAFRYSEAYMTPKAMEFEDISLLVRQFTDATERAVKAGIGKCTIELGISAANGQ
jgi:2,4-dienoyl-CoA reductase-like NADH-dependent reductase (Old Yellow Enzyme family)